MGVTPKPCPFEQYCFVANAALSLNTVNCKPYSSDTATSNFVIFKVIAIQGDLKDVCFSSINFWSNRHQVPWVGSICAKYGSNWLINVDVAPIEGSHNSRCGARVTQYADFRSLTLRPLPWKRPHFKTLQPPEMCPPDPPLSNDTTFILMSRLAHETTKMEVWLLDQSIKDHKRTNFNSFKYGTSVLFLLFLQSWLNLAI